MRPPSACAGREGGGGGGGGQAGGADMGMLAAEKPMMWKDFVSVGFVGFGRHPPVPLPPPAGEGIRLPLPRGSVGEGRGVGSLAHISHCWRSINRILGSFGKNAFEAFLRRS